MTSVVNVRVAELRKRGFNNFIEWNEQPNTLYIGRNMAFYVPRTYKSKWSNPFSAKKYGREECLRLYENYIRHNPELLNSLDELRGKELGCWCAPQLCHGHILQKLLAETNY